ncbi:hypothetical protein MNV49_005009 [Pseudohyphozyma bogoriensis]|nr:hypothetical protein MNV49_005009 [Pseudohyphozyma bogoriensis]
MPFSTHFSNHSSVDLLSPTLNKPLPLLPGQDAPAPSGKGTKQERTNSQDSQVSQGSKSGLRKRGFSTRALEIFSPRRKVSPPTPVHQVVDAGVVVTGGNRLRTFPSLLSLSSFIRESPKLSPTASEFSVESDLLLTPADEEFPVDVKQNQLMVFSPRIGSTGEDGWGGVKETKKNGKGY